MACTPASDPQVMHATIVACVALCGVLAVMAQQASPIARLRDSGRR